MVCEAPYPRSISQNFLDGFFPHLISIHLHILPFKVGLCHGIHDPVSPLLSRRRVSDERRQATNLYKTLLLSELSESQESGNHQDKTSISVSEYTRLARPALKQ